MSKQPTIHDVAAALGMHKSTVSVALSGKGNLSSATRERVHQMAREMSYEPNVLAQRLAHGGINDLVYVFSGTLDVGLAAEKILRIQQGLRSHFLEAPLYVCGEVKGAGITSQVEQMRRLRRQRPRAIVCATQRLDPNVCQELEKYQQDGGIVVAYDMPISLNCDQVIFDREDNAYQAARHLLEKGHRRLGLGISTIAGWSVGDQNHPLAYRLAGFQRALAEYGVPLRKKWIFENPTYEQGGGAMAREFLKLKDRPTGVCIVNDYVALAFAVEIMRAGVRVPDDVSIVAHDNQPITTYCPVALTSATQPVAKIAETVVKLLIERVEGKTAAPRTIVIKGKLVERETVAAPPK
jgi:DNA-binding LacI/PurR family transcriptional regulator